MELNFDILDSETDHIALVGYPYRAFRDVYEYLLAKCLYHQYWAEANETWPTFQYPQDALVHEVHRGTEIETEVVQSVLSDLIYNEQTKMQPMYYPIVSQAGSRDLIMIPQTLITSDAPSRLLRIHATKNPKHFLSRVSNHLGTRFVDKLANLFESQGFFVKKNVQLENVSKGAPDIDLLIVSRERTLGYFVFLIEAKSPIPSSWAKDHLRVTHSDSMPKAFKQVRRILDALKSEVGTDFMLKQVISMDPEPFPEGMMPLRTLIATSENAGMFFDTESSATSVVDYRTLTQIVQNSDGDVVYILKILNEARDAFQASYQSATQTFTMGNITVQYEVTQMSTIRTYEKNVWKSEGVDVSVADDFFANGGSRANPLG
ncbi:hypothetical protein GCM10010259_06640 [Streptomyces daghestanicus]|uniref:NERD domain-containing protein n=2 Tax=Streptomyces daghestanicus TaxID=66885 RepID=A0ABQ3PX84_9ACTN|nr:hypothetical protein GCM10010259_06640 [Streptomyces daghestanicus]GHI29632.1 hypothetical protein Sdagh_13620 [Streptomyces daghestanicus]